VLINALGLVATTLALGSVSFLLLLAAPLAPCLPNHGAAVRDGGLGTLRWTAVGSMAAAIAADLLNTAVLAGTLDLPTESLIGAGFVQAGIVEAMTLARSVIDAAGGGPVIAGGHSYGGRLTSMAVAMAGADSPIDVDALTLLSYPLHPPGRPDRLRTQHFGAITVPTVFTHGTADQFGSIAELRAAAGLITAPTEIIEITGARHDLASKRLDVPALAIDAALRHSVIGDGNGDGGSGTVDV
jgi:pimeloyl-ACP methyl ester carboxylesterase